VQFASSSSGACSPSSEALYCWLCSSRQRLILSTLHTARGPLWEESVWSLSSAWEFYSWALCSCCGHDLSIPRSLPARRYRERLPSQTIQPQFQRFDVV